MTYQDVVQLRKRVNLQPSHNLSPPEYPTHSAYAVNSLLPNYVSPYSSEVEDSPQPCHTVLEKGSCQFVSSIIIDFHCIFKLLLLLWPKEI